MENDLEKKLKLLEAEFEKQTRKEYELQLKLKQYKDRNKLEFFEPLWYQQRVIEAINSNNKKIIVMVGGNRIGKSTIGVVVVGSLCLGYQPWDKKETIFGNKPIRVRIMTTDWEKGAGEVIVPKLIEWLPYGSYETKKNNVGVESNFKFKNGSTIEILTHKQETRQMEGWSGHFLLLDEPCAKDKYIANKRGLIDFKGVVLFTMTALSEPWILDDIVLCTDKEVFAIGDIAMDENPYLDKQSIEEFKRSLKDEDEIVARIKGGWRILAGRVLKEFNADTHIIKPFKLPFGYPVVVMIDLHLNKPQAIGFYTVDRMGRQFVIDEVWENISPEEIADAIIRRKRQNLWDLKTVFIDPLSKGDSQFMKNRFDVEDSFSIIKNLLQKEDITLFVASKDKESGVRNIKNFLMGMNNIPSLFFFETCKRHIHEIMRWVYDEDGKPSKSGDDHFMENLYRFTLTGTRFIEEPVIIEKDFVYEPFNYIQ